MYTLISVIILLFVDYYDSLPTTLPASSFAPFFLPSNSYSHPGDLLISKMLMMQLSCLPLCQVPELPDKSQSLCIA